MSIKLPQMDIQKFYFAPGVSCMLNIYIIHNILGNFRFQRAIDNRGKRTGLSIDVLYCFHMV